MSQKTAKRQKTRRNADRLEYAEVGSSAEVALGSGVRGAGPNRFLQLISESFGGGAGFTAGQLAREAGESESGARAAIKALRARGYVHELGRDLTPMGTKGAMRYVATLVGEERAQAARDVAVEVAGERAAVETIEEAERRQAAALADFLGTERAKPGQGKVYRPTIRRQKTRGHKLPKLTASRILGQGYKVCNPAGVERNPDDESRRLARLAAEGDERAAAKLARLEGHASGRMPPVEGDLWVSAASSGRSRDSDVGVYRVTKQGRWATVTGGERLWVNQGLSELAHTWVVRRKRLLVIFDDIGTERARRGEARPARHVAAPDFTVLRLVNDRYAGARFEVVAKYLGPLMRPGQRVHVARGVGEWETVFEKTKTNARRARRRGR